MHLRNWGVEEGPRFYTARRGHQGSRALLQNLSALALLLVISGFEERSHLLVSALEAFSKVKLRGPEVDGERAVAQIHVGLSLEDVWRQKRLLGV